MTILNLGNTMRQSHFNLVLTGGPLQRLATGLALVCLVVGSPVGGPPGAEAEGPLTERIPEGENLRKLGVEAFPVHRRWGADRLVTLRQAPAAACILSCPSAERHLRRSNDPPLVCAEHEQRNGLGAPLLC